ncbi:hypothetical protein RE6C_06067 [Rhodopirellula europaea 6C]|uniref:Uncharacterized protein n=1 Tax=Rhodopirellula europaea 6C TaxID=1263867 RepID=M2A365_9BACT|nr:hypothetical protein RE6C_06067 [Rhodopirellula europaea 6C]
MPRYSGRLRNEGSPTSHRMFIVSSLWGWRATAVVRRMSLGVGE